MIDCSGSTTSFIDSGLGRSPDASAAKVVTAARAAMAPTPARNASTMSPIQPAVVGRVRRARGARWDGYGEACCTRGGLREGQIKGRAALGCRKSAIRAADITPGDA